MLVNYTHAIICNQTRIMGELIKPLGISATRNSSLRQETTQITAGLAEVIDNTIPGLTPTHLNIIGGLLIMAGSTIATGIDWKNPNKVRVILAATFLTIGSAFDGIDGPLARKKALKNPNSVDFKKGQIYDALGDRVQEVVEAISRGINAHQRRSRFGEIAAFSAAVTSTFPSIARAYAEVLGKPVPETGRGLFGLLGARVGRAISGIITTTIPQANGLALQPTIDSLITIANVKNAFDRLEVAGQKSVKLLPQETREEARTRLIALGIFGVIATGASLFTYWRLNRSQIQKKEALKSDYIRIINEIEKYCQESGLDHRFVGGTLTDLIGPQTEFEIDIDRKRINLKNPNYPSLIRSDGTSKDVDLAVFTPDKTKFEAAKQLFKEWGLKAREGGLQFPHISVEAAKHPNWQPRRNKFKQFVTVFEYDQEGNPYLTFGSIDQKINPDSLEPWTIEAEHGIKISTFNPVAHTLCYALRVPSGVKKKDKEVIGTDYSGKPYNKMGMIGRLAHEMLTTGREKGIDYKSEYYTDWINYIHTLSRKPDLLTKIKGMITGLYWDTIGTKVAHGAGVFAKLSTLSNRFTG